jgi:hypothetical protein
MCDLPRFHRAMSKRPMTEATAALNTTPSQTPSAPIPSATPPSKPRNWSRTIKRTTVFLGLLVGLAAAVGHLAKALADAKQEFSRLFAPGSSEKPDTTNGVPNLPAYANSLNLTNRSSPIRITTNISQRVTAFGGWRLSGKDPQMDTNFRDQVPVTCTTSLSITTNEVRVVISFSCREQGGNKTGFSGVRTFHVFSPPKGQSVESVKFRGKNPVTFSSKTHGKNHALNPFDTSKTFWSELSFRIDTTKADDSPFVGVAGTLDLEIDILP